MNGAYLWLTYVFIHWYSVGEDCFPRKLILFNTYNIYNPWHNSRMCKDQRNTIIRFNETENQGNMKYGRLYCTKMLEHKSSLKNVWYTMAGYLIILAPAINKEDVSIYVNLMHFSLKFSSRFQLIRHAKQKLFIISTYLTCHYKKEETQLIYTMLRSIYILTILLQTPFLIQLMYP